MSDDGKTGSIFSQSLYIFNKEPTDVWISEGNEEIKSGRTLKLLGFQFSEKPDVSEQVNYLIKKVMARFYVHRNYSTFMGGG